MKNTIKLNHANRQIVMDRTFSKLAENVRNDEYSILQSVRRDYPTYQVVTRQIKRNPNKESYHGLTYQYMEDYILTHEPRETREAVLARFDEMRLISMCHSSAFRYPVIKKWFLAQYPEIRDFGMPNSKEDKIVDIVQENTPTSKASYIS